MHDVEEESMVTQVMRVSVIACMAMTILLLAGEASAASAAHHPRIRGFP
jgi:hypothetical protein